MEKMNQSPLELLKGFCRYNFINRDCEHAARYLSSDVHWFGTGEDEDIHSREEAARHMETEISAVPSTYKIEYMEESEKLITGELGAAYAKLILIGSTSSLLCRISITSCQENGRNVICCLVDAGKAAAGQRWEDFLS